MTRPPAPQGARNPFTLIELLVVIAIIAVLASMLLPALSRAREQARRAACLNDRKQIGVSIMMFADDFEDRLPSATAFRDSGGFDGLTPSTQMHWHGATSATSPSATYGPQGYQTHEGSASDQEVFALGTLSRLGYVGDRDILYCPSYVSTDTNATVLRGDTKYWKSWTTGDLNPAQKTFRYRLGIVHLMHTPRRNTDVFSFPTWPVPPLVTNAYASRPGMRLADVADTWKSDADVSPFLVACLNRYVSDTAFYAGEDISHDGAGVNALRYDGSARWIGVSEVHQSGWVGYTHTNVGYGLRFTSTSIYLENHRAGTQTNSASNFVAWARAATDL